MARWNWQQVGIGAVLVLLVIAIGLAVRNTLINSPSTNTTAVTAAATAAPTSPPAAAATAAPTSPPAAAATAAPTSPPAAAATAAPTSPPAAAATAAPTGATCVPANTGQTAAMSTSLRFSTATLVKILRGDIKKWNDDAIQTENPGIQLPDLEISFFHRSDNSGTTRIFTEYPVQADSWWASHVGAAGDLDKDGILPGWPTDRDKRCGRDRNDGVARAVQETPGSIGYVEATYAQTYHLPVVAIGRTIEGSEVSITPTISSLQASAEAAGLLDESRQLRGPRDKRLRGFIVNVQDRNAYPIAGYSYAMICPAMQDDGQATALTDFIYWALTDKDALDRAKELGYALPPLEIRQQAIKQLEKVRVQSLQAFRIPAQDEQWRPRRVGKISLEGSGATFPAPLYNELIKLYQGVNSEVTITYAPVGSGQGKRDILAGQVQFAGTDEPLNDREAIGSSCGQVPLHIPIAVGGVAIIYHLP